jgi:hypothetical protein
MCRGYFSSQEIDAHHATEHRSTDQSRNGCGMCCFCHAQPFEITRAEKIKSTLLQHSRQNAKVVEAFCHAACRLSNQCRPSIHQPPVDEFRMPAEMSIALSRAHVHARRLVLAPRPPSRSPPTYDLHSTRCTAGCHTSRDFVPWRFSGAGRRSAWIASSCRRPKTYTIAEVADLQPTSRGTTSSMAQGKAQSPQRQSRVYSTKRKSNLTLRSGERVRASRRSRANASASGLIERTEFKIKADYLR